MDAHKLQSKVLRSLLPVLSGKARWFVMYDQNTSCTEATLFLGYRLKCLQLRIQSVNGSEYILAHPGLLGLGCLPMAGTTFLLADPVCKIMIDAFVRQHVALWKARAVVQLTERVKQAQRQLDELAFLPEKAP